MSKPITVIYEDFKQELANLIDKAQYEKCLLNDNKKVD